MLAELGDDLLSQPLETRGVEVENDARPRLVIRLRIQDRSGVLTIC